MKLDWAAGLPTEQLLSKKLRIPSLQKLLESGINFFDTANAYNRGEGEKALEAALADYNRSSYVLSTKVYFPIGDGPNDRGLSRKHILEQCEASLKRLGVDYIDIIHLRSLKKVVIFKNVVVKSYIISTLYPVE